MGGGNGGCRLVLKCRGGCCLQWAEGHHLTASGPRFLPELIKCQKYDFGQVATFSSLSFLTCKLWLVSPNS